MTPRSSRTHFLASVLLAVAIAGPSALAGSAGVDAASLVTQPAWLTTGKMNVARVGHTPTLLTDGKVLVVGGWGNASTGQGLLDSAELYDPATGTWSFAGSLSRSRVGYTATLLNDGRVLVAGGDTSPGPPDFGRTSSAELYDP